MIKAVIFDMYETLITHYHTPLYFSEAMSKDLGIAQEDFLALWRPTNEARTTGKISLEEILDEIMKANHIDNPSKKEYIIQKRLETKRDCFRHLHVSIIPMLEGLKKKGIKIGLISNCFSEEVIAIEESVLYPYFDVVYLSYQKGLMKPDPQIYLDCMKELEVKAGECLYIGDGGSNELYAASKLGMKAMQAIWYIQYNEHVKRMDANFEWLNDPIQILEKC